jgi:hypothetical protein
MHMTSYFEAIFTLFIYHFSDLNIIFRDDIEDCARKLYRLI